jgi:hypothetical protein
MEKLHTFPGQTTSAQKFCFIKKGANTMNRFRSLCLLALTLGLLGACGRRNHYDVKVTVLRQNQQPAVGFRVSAHVTNRSTPVTIETDAKGVAHFDSLPTPDKQNPLVAVVHYYRGPNDADRDITYPFIESDAKRLTDTQYIPNDATPEPQSKS